MKGLKEIFQTYESQTHTGIAVIKYGTVDFKQKLVRRDKKRSLHINKGNNTSRRNNNYEHIRAKYQCSQLY
jgi:hypothetical protein